MRTQMMHRNKRLAGRQRQSLGKVDAHQQGADEPRRIGHRQRVDGVEREVCLFERLRHHRHDRFGMTARGDLGHDAAVQTVLLHL